MKKIYQHEALEWSNLFFLIPLAIAINYNLYWYTIILGIVFVVSFDFHFLHEAKSVYYFDVIFSSILMLSNTILLLLGHLKLPYSIMAIIFALIALIFYFRRSKHDYYINHSLWHIFSALVCLSCLITFISFN